MKNQQEHWQQLHLKSSLTPFSGGPTGFAVQVAGLLPAQSQLLELGCGEGNDATYFAKLGHSITATDFSEVAIRKNKTKPYNKNLTFETQDIGKPFSFKASSFTCVYARLSLHYFDHETTRAIFGEIARVLKPNGLFCFICKSTDDDLYGRGKAIEPDMFEYNGHVRHFFSKQYAQSLLSKAFTIKDLQLVRETVYDGKSSVLKVIATKG